MMYVYILYFATVLHGYGSSGGGDRGKQAYHNKKNVVEKKRQHKTK